MQRRKAQKLETAICKVKEGEEVIAGLNQKNDKLEEAIGLKII